MIVTFDVETTIKNKGNPFTKSNRMVSYALKEEEKEVYPEYHDHVEYTYRLKKAVEAAKLLIGFNIKFDLHWAARHGIYPNDRVRVWDCQIAEFILRGFKGSYPSLNEALERFGLGQKDDEVAEYWDVGIDTTEIPRETLLRYNARDVELTYQLYLQQYKALSEKQRTLCILKGLDLLVLQEMEENGIKYDVEKSKQLAAETELELGKITKQLMALSPSPHINLDSGQQLSILLYGGNLEFEVLDHAEIRVYKSGAKKGQEYEKKFFRTETATCPRLFEPLPKTQLKLSYLGQDVYQTGEEVLKTLRAPRKEQKAIIQLLLQRAKLEKLLSTYYRALPELLEEMEWGEYIHGSLNQCVAATGRLSSSKPNTQNFAGVVDDLIITRF